MQNEKLKLIDLNELAHRIEQLKTNGKTIVHCHGCFDLMHPGHIKYFQAAKNMGDVLVVTVTADEFVDKGQDRPVFNQNLRVESIAALECVDFVSVNKWDTAENTLRLLKPDFYESSFMVTEEKIELPTSLMENIEFSENKSDYSIFIIPIIAIIGIVIYLKKRQS